MFVWKRRPKAALIEAATEREAIKRQIFADVGKVLGSEAILASNTSSIPITRLAQAAPDPARFVGVHFFNPVPVMGLIELIRGLATSDATVAAVEAGKYSPSLEAAFRIAESMYADAGGAEGSA